MGDSVLIQFRVEERLKSEAVEVMDRLGLDLPTAMRMFLKRVVLEQGLPFSTSLPRERVAEDIGAKEERKVIRIPARKSVRIPRETVEYLIRQVPAGKITRYEDIQQFLQSFYGYERVELEPESVMTFLTDETFPYWRVVGSTGFLPSRHSVYDDEKMAQMLNKEGLSVSMAGPKKALYKVDEYKEHLFDFSSIPLTLESK